MAKLGRGQDTQETIQCLGIPSKADAVSNIKVTLTGAASVASAVLTGGQYRCVSSVACFLKQGTAPTATALSMPLQALKEEYFNIEDGNKVAAFSTPSGTLTMTLME